MGQLKSIAETFYKLELSIEVLDQEIKFDTIHVSFQAGPILISLLYKVIIKIFSPQLSFENKAGRKRNSALVREEARLPAVQSSMLFDIFPFVMTYGPDMVIANIGRSLMMVPVLGPKLMMALFNMKISADPSEISWSEDQRILRHRASSY